jgi:hypothetical protein
MGEIFFQRIRRFPPAQPTPASAVTRRMIVVFIVATTMVE